MTTHWTVDSSLPPTPPDTPDDGINHFNSRKMKAWREHQWREAPLPRGLSLSWTLCRCLRLRRRCQLSPAESPSVARRPWCRPHSPEPSLWSYRCLRRKSGYFEQKGFSPCKAGTTRSLYLISFLLNKKVYRRQLCLSVFFFLVRHVRHHKRAEKWGTAESIRSLPEDTEVGLKSPKQQHSESDTLVLFFTRADDGSSNQWDISLLSHLCWQLHMCSSDQVALWLGSPSGGRIFNISYFCHVFKLNLERCLNRGGWKRINKPSFTACSPGVFTTEETPRDLSKVLVGSLSRWKRYKSS